MTVPNSYRPQRWLLNFKDSEGQLVRWLEVLSRYDMRIDYSRGTKHGNADALSRIPCRQCGYNQDGNSRNKRLLFNLQYLKVQRANLRQ